MADWIRILKIGGIILGMLLVYSLMSAPGLGGKIIGIIIIAVVAFFYFVQMNERRVFNPVTKYYQNMLELAHRNRPKNLRNLVMTGDKENQGFVKGYITGGALAIRNNELLYRVEQVPVYQTDAKGRKLKDKKGALIPLLDQTGMPVMEEKKIFDTDMLPGGANFDPRADAYVFSYTRDTGLLHSLPLIGSMIPKKEFLIKIYKHQLKEQSIYGDIYVKGVSTDFVGLLEVISDWSVDKDIELNLLNREVERLTLVDNLGMLPIRIRNAVDSNSRHLINMDLRDEVIPPSR